MSRFLSLLCCLSVLVAFVPCFAHANEKQARAYIDSLAEQTLQIIKTDVEKDTKKTQLKSLFARNVDIKWVGKFVMGRYWRKATQEQQTRYLNEYEQFILGHYAERFTEYTSGDYNITGYENSGDGEYLVSMEMINPGKPNEAPVLVDYRVRQNGNNFMVFDVIIEGVSMITTQRSEFASVISRNGIDYLIDQLANKTMKISASQ
ncbi:MAG: phospholipid-binding protein MlaC [Alphaproteobacteria bacterium]